MTAALEGAAAGNIGSKTADGGTDGLVSHPAALAWSEFAASSIVPERIDVLRHGDKSVTVRLFGVGPSRTPVIAQRSRIEKAAVERIVYDQILPHLPLTAPRFYGYKPDGPGHAWLFLEDVGDQRYVETDPVHRNLAGRWVGLLHSAASQVPASRSLPDGGPLRYLGHLRDGRDIILANLGNRSLTAADREFLRVLIADLHGVSAGWASIEQLCAEMPATLVHGDFRKKNAYVRKGRDGLAIFPIDWETAGWGAPAADLTRIDLPAYASVVHACWWSDITLEKVQRLAVVGRIFWALAGIFWISPQLGYQDDKCLVRPILCLRRFQQRLIDGLRELRESV